MIKKISVKNFYSIDEEQEISMEITSKDILDDSARKVAKMGGALNLVSCVIGHNASGKTTILKAITFLFSLINRSYTSFKSEDKIPFEPHELKRNDSSEIMIEFCNKETFYKYRIKFNQKEILEECLHKKKVRWNLVFELKRDEENIAINASSLKLNKTDEVRFKERHNVALLSSLIDTGYLSEITYFKYFESNVSPQYGLVHGSMPVSLVNISQTMYEDKSFSQGIFDFIKSIDLGMSGFAFGDIRSSIESEQEEALKMLECLHKTKKGNFLLPIFKESNGTQHSIALLSKILPTLKIGGLLIVDEIESGLHPHVVKKLISLFENKQSNPNNAQLIFSTHQHWLINDRTKTQIFITEKNEETLSTEIYCLDNVDSVRNDENYFHKYMAGAYGGTPKFNWM